MKRILWLDMLRGYALVCIMLDHMPLSVLKVGTLTHFSVYDAAELFVLLSGFLVGMVWAKVEARQGQAAAQWRFARRSFQVWRALVIGGVLLAVLTAGLARAGLPFTTVWPGYADWFLAHPFGYVVTLGLLWMQPNLMDVLALYVILLATAPLAVPFLRRWPWRFALVSLAIWAVARELNALVPNERAVGGLLFNPFGWQVLFYAGVAMGLFGRQIRAALIPWSGWVTALTAGMAFTGFLLAAGWRFGPAGKEISDALIAAAGDIDKWSMDSLRMLSILAASWLVAVPLSGVMTRIADTRIGRAAAEIGRGGLFSFVVCVLLSILGDALQMTPEDQPALRRAAIDLWTVGALWVASHLWLGRPGANAPPLGSPAR